MKTTWWAVLAVSLVTGAVAHAETGEEFGLRFWKALSQGDTVAMEPCYAPKVTLLPGSELLKKEWGINPGGDRSKAVEFKREELLTGYKAMIAKIGAEKWKAAFSKIGRDKISFVVATAAGQTFKGVTKGDVVMTVATGSGDDRLAFILSETAGQAWCVRMESADY